MKKKNWLQHKEFLIDILVRLICKLDGIDQGFKISDVRIYKAYDALMSVNHTVLDRSKLEE